MIANLALAAALVVTGGTGDFYKTGSCSPTGGSPTNAGKVTNYDYGTGQRVHTSMVNVTISGKVWTRETVRVNGKTVTASEAYTYIEDEHAKVTVEFVWGRYLSDRQCNSYITGG